MSRASAAILAGFFALGVHFSSLAQTTLPRSSDKALPRNLVGDTITDGVGYGGVRIGGTETELLAKWGLPGQVTTSGSEKSYLYSLDSGEVVGVFVKDGRVDRFLFLPSRNLSLPSGPKTLRAVAVGDPFSRVRKAYGSPDSQKTDWLFYTSLGIGFSHEAGLVAVIVIFQPGKPPE